MHCIFGPQMLVSKITCPNLKRRKLAIITVEACASPVYGNQNKIQRYSKTFTGTYYSTAYSLLKNQAILIFQQYLGCKRLKRNGSPCKHNVQTQTYNLQRWRGLYRSAARMVWALQLASYNDWFRNAMTTATAAIIFFETGSSKWPSMTNEMWERAEGLISRRWETYLRSSVCLVEGKHPFQKPLDFHKSQKNHIDLYLSFNWLLLRAATM